MNRVLPFWALVTASSFAGFASDDIPPPRPRVDVAALVKQLGSEDYAEREVATKRLSTLNVEAPPPELLAALRSQNPEVRTRASKALKALREHIAHNRAWAAAAHLPRAERFAKRGQIDLFVASTAGDYKADDPRVWAPLVDVCRATVERSDRARGCRTSPGPVYFSDFAWYKKDHGPRLTRTEARYENQERGPCGIQAPGVRSHVGFGCSIVVSRGLVDTARGSEVSLFLAAGDFDCGDYFSRSVVICDGNVRVKGHVDYSLIVARGDISVEGSARASTLIAGGKVTIGTPPKPVSPIPVADPEKESERKSEWCQRVIIEEKVSRPLGYITFFELSTIGLEVKVADKVVTVAKVAAGKPFALAGVRVGDVVVEVNGKKPESAESLRRMLRDALAIGDATVKLRRGEKTETVKVTLPE